MVNLRTWLRENVLFDGENMLFGDTFEKYVVLASARFKMKREKTEQGVDTAKNVLWKVYGSATRLPYPNPPSPVK